MKIENLIILDRYYDRQADAWLILGRQQKNEMSLPSFTTAWSPRLAPQDIYQAQSFLDEASARRRFERIIMNDGHPQAKIFNKDLQKKSVYVWEDENLDPCDRDVQNRDSAKTLIQTIARDYKIRPPKTVWGKAGRSNYDSDSNTLDLADLSLLRLLHEMAHAVHLGEQQTYGIDPDLSPDHGPAFVWIAVELYHRYGGLDLSYLIETANQSDLLGSMEKNQNLFPERRAFSFPVSVRKLCP